MFKVSVIIPVYNREKFLGRCLESVMNQSLKDIEIICIDDGSTDKSIEILKTYAQKNNRIKILTQKNSGPSMSRNIGLKIAQSEYVSFVDSDDWIDLEFLEKLYSTAKKYNADIACAGIKRLRSYKWKYHLKFEKEEFTENIDRKFQLCDVPEKCYVWNKIYKLSELQKHKLLFEPNILYEDRYFTCEALVKFKRLVVIPDVYYNYWTNPSSIVKTKSEKNSRDNLYTYEKMMDYLKENNINLDHYVKDFKRYSFCGFTILKIKTYKNRKEYRLFNILKYVRKLK